MRRTKNGLPIITETGPDGKTKIYEPQLLHLNSSELDAELKAEQLKAWKNFKIPRRPHRPGTYAEWIQKYGHILEAQTGMSLEEMREKNLGIFSR